MTDQDILNSLDLENPAYLEIKLTNPDDFNSYLNYFVCNKIPYTPDWWLSILSVRNNAGNNTRRIYLVPQGQFIF